MSRSVSIILFLVACFTSNHTYAEPFGKFVGTVKTEWIDEDGRKMRLLASYKYIDPRKMEWDAPKDWIVDGASIPQFAWSFIGGPFEGKYRNASVIHDVACDQKTRPWELVHEAFYWAMRAAGVGKIKAQIMYAAVYHFGPRWPWNTKIPVNNLTTDISRALGNLGQVAAPKSYLEILSVLPTSGDQLNGELTDNRVANIIVGVTPPTTRITQAEFTTLKKMIEAQYPSNEERVNSNKGLSVLGELDSDREKELIMIRTINSYQGKAPPWFPEYE